MKGASEVSKHLLRAKLPLRWCGLIGGIVGILGCTLALGSFRPLYQDTISTDAASQKDIISQTQLLSQLKTSTTLQILDVRTAAEYTSGHVPGALNIPIQELSERIDELGRYNRNAPIIVYCEQGIRGHRGVTLLHKAGFTHVQQLEGDMKAWREREYPMTVSASEESAGAQNGGNTSLSQPAQFSSIAFESQWIVSPAQAMHLIATGATLLDAQGKGFGLKRFPGASVVSWQQFSEQDSPHRGKVLEDDEALTLALQELGISKDRPVVVFANPPHGWGEDGRIVWMLRTLGHSKAVMVDGGIKALLAQPEVTAVPPRDRGDFVVHTSRHESSNSSLDWDIQKDDLKSIINASSLSPTRPMETHNGSELSSPEPSRQDTFSPPILIDTREPREYAGATPYGEQRGGHVPGAVNLYFKDLLTQDGYLLPETELHEVLHNYGITPDRRAIAYCTGGIRSGWLTAVLVNYGYQVENYAGSMWEWAAAPAEGHPLQ